jgi:hypothetical protein
VHITPPMAPRRAFAYNRRFSARALARCSYCFQAKGQD